MTAEDLERERIVEEFVATPSGWQANGWIPDMRIEVGGHHVQGLDLIRARGWTHWHHLLIPGTAVAGNDESSIVMLVC